MDTIGASGSVKPTGAISGACAENICIQEFVAEFSLWIEFLTQGNKFRKLFVNGMQFAGRNCEEFSQGTWFERSQFALNNRQEFAHGRPVLFPG